MSISPAGKPRIAFYAPLKYPGHPVPSGDRRVARQLLAALKRADFDPFVVSEFQSFDKAGNATVEDMLFEKAEEERGRLEAKLMASACLSKSGYRFWDKDSHQQRDRALSRLHKSATSSKPPALWFTYHLYYKAPDLIGPMIARALKIPYVVAEASHAPRRLEGPWSSFAEATLNAIKAADLIYVMSKRDHTMLESARGHAKGLVTLAPFLDPGPAPVARTCAPSSSEGPVRLITVAMMRPGDKLASYQMLASALSTLPDGAPWSLDIVGDGPARTEVETAFRPFGTKVSFKGQIDAPDALRHCQEDADLFVWPGIGEAYGMAYLEAQAAGTPVAAVNFLGVQTVVEAGSSGWLSDGCGPREAQIASYGALLAGLVQKAGELKAMGARARGHIVQSHSEAMAADTLRRTLMPLIEDERQSDP